MSELVHIKRDSEKGRCWEPHEGRIGEGKTVTCVACLRDALASTEAGRAKLENEIRAWQSLFAGLRNQLAIDADKDPNQAADFIVDEALKGAAALGGIDHLRDLLRMENERPADVAARAERLLALAAVRLLEGRS